MKISENIHALSQYQRKLEKFRFREKPLHFQGEGKNKNQNVGDFCLQFF